MCNQTNPLVYQTTLIILLLTATTSFIFSVNKATSVLDNAQTLAQGFNVFILVSFSFICYLFHYLISRDKQTFATLLHHFEYTRNPIASGVLLIYWLLQVILGSVKLRTLLVIHRSTGNHPDHFAIYLVQYALTIFVFVLENIPKPKKQYILLDDEDEVNWKCYKQKKKKKKRASC